MTEKIAADIAAPNNDLLQLVKNVNAPAIVTPVGVVSPSVMRALIKGQSPVLPPAGKPFQDFEGQLEKAIKPAEKAIRPTGKLGIVKADVTKPFSETKGPAEKGASFAKLPILPTMREPTSIKEPVQTDELDVSPRARRPSIPQRPKLDMPSPKALPRDVYKAPKQAPVDTRQPYSPPKTVYPTSPYGEPKKVYEPTRPTYTAPRDDYQPSSSMRSIAPSSIPGDVYSPPSFESSWPGSRSERGAPESNRTPESYFNPQYEVEPEEAPVEPRENKK